MTTLIPTVKSLTISLPQFNDGLLSLLLTLCRSVRKRAGGVVSYKEQESEDELSAGEEDGEEAEVNGEAEPEDEEHVETIQKIMDVRQGKKGGRFYGLVLLSQAFPAYLNAVICY